MIRIFLAHDQRHPPTIPHRRWLWRLLALAVLALACSPLHAACTVSTNGVVFGNYDGSEVDITGEITVAGCTTPTSYTIALSQGFSGNFITRIMQNTSDASHTLNYNLYTNLSHANVWGNGTNSSMVSDTGTGGTYPIYGRILSGQNPYVGSYSDAIIVTLQF